MVSPVLRRGGAARFPTTLYLVGVLSATVLGIAVCSGGAAAKSTAQKECAGKYQVAKAANTLNGLTYNQFRKQCAAEAKAGTAAPPQAAPVAPTTTSAPVAPPQPVPTTTAAAPAPAPAPAVAPAPPPVAPTATVARQPAAPAPAPAPLGNAVFPTALSPSFAGEKPGRAREKTCLAQYNANKTANGNGGLKWIQKGGGYYSQCNKRLKGEA